MKRFLFFTFLTWLVIASPTYAAEPFPTVENLHHNLHVTLNPDRRSISVKDEITLIGKGLVSFRLSSPMVLMEMFVNGRKSSPMARQDEFVFALPKDDQPHKIVLIYTGQFKNLETYLQQPRKYRGFIDAQGSFLSGATGWYPRFNAKHFTYSLSVKTPALHRAIAPGTLVEESTTKGVYHAIFKVDHPIDEIPLFAGPYQVREKFVDGIRVRTYFHATLNGLEGDYLDTTAQYLKRFSQQISKYPYSAFHIISSPLPVGYGYPYLTYMGANVLRLPFIKHTSLGHEVLHNWWGNGVWVDYDKGNWAEGLTTYMADYAFAKDRGEVQAKEKRLNWLRDYSALPKERDKAVTSFISKTHTASQVVGYNKVAFIFHMLKKKIGEEAFTKGIQRFWRDKQFTQASWKDLQFAFEQESELSLNRFFSQWLNQPGAPKLKIGKLTTNPDGSSYKTSLEILQSGKAYQLSVPISLDKQSFTAELRGASTTLSFNTPRKPEFVAIDPNYDIFRHLAEGETPPILRDVTLATQTKVMILNKDAAFKASAVQLAERMLDTKPQLASGTTSLVNERPYLVIGTNQDIAEFLAQNSSLTPPTQLIKGTSAAWATKPKNGSSIVIIKAEDTKALKDLLRPLPHYGRRSYVVFQGAKAVSKGVWPATANSALKQKIQ
ncbi:MAG: M1 family aminopeptidase [Rhodospirillales bacterium]|nr:M1 family aminopeptidase [Rhodospirillales bacterium]